MAFKSIQNMILRSKILDTKHVSVEVSNRDTQVSYFITIDLSKIDQLAKDPAFTVELDDNHEIQYSDPMDQYRQAECRVSEQIVTEKKSAVTTQIVKEDTDTESSKEVR